MGDQKDAVRKRLDGFSWGLWAERAVVRALDIAPSERVTDALLHGAPLASMALLIARAVGYLAGTQHAPDMPASLRGWLDSVSMGEPPSRGPRLGGLSWDGWARRAAVLAVEIEPDRTLEAGPLAGLPLWKVAITIARSVAFLSGAERAPELASGLRDWLTGAATPQATTPQEEQAP